MDKIWQLPFLVNNILAEHSMSAYSHITYGCFSTSIHRAEELQRFKDSLSPQEYLTPNWEHSWTFHVQRKSCIKIER